MISLISFSVFFPRESVHKIIQFSSVKLLSWFLFSYDSVTVGIIISQKKNHVYSTDFFIIYSLYRIREIYN